MEDCILTKKAIIYVDNKENIIPFSQFLVSSGWTIISGDETENLLKSENIPVVHESGLTENINDKNDTFEVIRKLLNSNLKSDSSDNISLVCINLSPLKEKAGSNIISDNFYLTSILRNCFVNYKNLLVLTDPEDYHEAEIQIRTDCITDSFRAYLVGKMLNMISAYDGIVSHQIFKNSPYADKFSTYLSIPYKKIGKSLAGLNPQQEACIYIKDEDFSFSNNSLKKIYKDLPCNIITDVSFALEQIRLLFNYFRTQFTVKSVNCDNYEYTTQFTPLTGTVFTIAVKYKSIIGAALADNTLDSFYKTFTYDTDKISGAVFGCSAVIDEKVANEIVKSNFTAIFAPDFTNEARLILGNNKGIRLITISTEAEIGYDTEFINSGFLIQTKDNLLFDKWFIKTLNRPSQSKIDQMAFGMLLVMHMKTYSAVLIKQNSLVGIAQGDISSVDAVDEVLNNSKKNHQRSKVSENTDDKILADVLVCDTAISLCDSIKELISCGLSAIIQPGGLLNDDEFIKYCNEHDVVLVFTGMTHISY